MYSLMTTFSYNHIAPGKKETKLEVQKKEDISYFLHGNPKE